METLESSSSILTQMIYLMFGFAAGYCILDYLFLKLQYHSKYNETKGRFPLPSPNMTYNTKSSSDVGQLKTRVHQECHLSIEASQVLIKLVKVLIQTKISPLYYKNKTPSQDKRHCASEPFMDALTDALSLFVGKIVGRMHSVLTCASYAQDWTRFWIQWLHLMRDHINLLRLTGSKTNNSVLHWACASPQTQEQYLQSQCRRVLQAFQSPEDQTCATARAFVMDKLTWKITKLLQDHVLTPHFWNTGVAYYIQSRWSLPPGVFPWTFNTTAKDNIPGWQYFAGHLVTSKEQVGNYFQLSNVQPGGFMIWQSSTTTSSVEFIISVQMKDQDQIQHEECVFRPHEYRSKGQPVESACDHLEAYLESKADLFVKGIDFRQKAPTDDDSFIRLAFQSLAASSSCSSSGALNLLHQQMKDKIAALSPNKEPKETAVVVPNSISPDKQQPIEVHDHQFTIELQHQHFILQLQQKFTLEHLARAMIDGTDDWQPFFLEWAHSIQQLLMDGRVDTNTLDIWKTIMSQVAPSSAQARRDETEFQSIARPFSYWILRALECHELSDRMTFLLHPPEWRNQYYSPRAFVQNETYGQEWLRDLRAFQLQIKAKYDHPSQHLCRVFHTERWIQSAQIRGHAIGVESSNRVVRYAIEIHDVLNQRWVVHKRYSEFSTFMQTMRVHFPTIHFAFPPKRAFGNYQPSFLQDREQKLNRFLQVCLGPHLGKHPLVHVFLQNTAQRVKPRKTKTQLLECREDANDEHIVTLFGTPSKATSLDLWILLQVEDAGFEVLCELFDYYAQFNVINRHLVTMSRRLLLVSYQPYLQRQYQTFVGHWTCPFNLEQQCTNWLLRCPDERAAIALYRSNRSKEEREEWAGQTRNIMLHFFRSFDLFCSFWGTDQIEHGVDSILSFFQRPVFIQSLLFHLLDLILQLLSVPA